MIKTCLTLILVFFGFYQSFAQIPVTDTLQVSATEALTAIQASAWYKQAADMAAQITTMTDTLVTVQEQLTVAEDALDTAMELNDYVGDPSKILGKFKGKFVSPELAEFASTVQNTVKKGEDLYDQYNDVEKKWTSTVDKYKKFQAIEDLTKISGEKKKDISKKRKEILSELQKLGDQAASADTDIEVQKTATAISATKASLEVLNAEERSIQDQVVNQHLRNTNAEAQRVQRDIDLMKQIWDEQQSDKSDTCKKKK